MSDTDDSSLSELSTPEVHNNNNSNNDVPVYTIDPDDINDIEPEDTVEPEPEDTSDPELVKEKEPEDIQDDIEFDTNSNTLKCLSDTPLGEDDDWKNVVVARMALWGEGGVQAYLTQSKDGSESGSAHGSVRDRQTVKQSVLNRWVMVEQPMGYVTRISGYHSVYGKACLLHSVKFEFASGQVIEFEGTREDWKGEEFVVQNLADNFYVSALEFDGGVCSGYRGFSTPKPLHDLMENESEPDMELLLNQDFSEEDEEDPYLRKKQDNANDNNEEEDDLQHQQDLTVWRPESLKAKENPRPEQRESMMLAYVCLLGRDALQGAIFYFYDGHREGKLSAVRKRGIACCKGFKLETDIHCDVEQFDIRGATFVPVEQPGGRIMTISGRNLTRTMPSTTTEKGPKVTYLCHTLNLQFSSGQIIKFVGSNDDWKGQYFSYTMPSDFYVNQFEFAPARVGSPGPGGILVGVSGVRTYDDASDLDLPPIENTKPPCWDTWACCLP